MFSPTQGTPLQPAAAETYSAVIDQPDGGSPNATLNAAFNQVGVWQITATVNVSYTDVPAPDSWAGTANVTINITVNSASPTPTLTLVADKYAICAGGQNDSLHEANLTVTVTDGQGNPMPGVSVLFSTSDGSLSLLTGVTDANGQAPTTLTSSQNATDSAGIYQATVTASLESAPSQYYAITQIEFQPATVSLSASPNLIFNGSDPSTLTLSLTWNGSPVNGHTITWQIAEIWDANWNEVYNGTGSPPSGYATLGSSSSASPSNAQGQATQTLVAGPNVGFVVVAALDTSVIGAVTRLNPQGQAQVGLNADIMLTKIEFLDDDHVIRNGGLLDDKATLNANPYPLIQWVAKTTNAPMTMPTVTTSNLKIKFHLTVSANIAANTACQIVGASTEAALTFNTNQTISPGQDVVLTFSASKPLGPTIRKIYSKITWNLSTNTNGYGPWDSGPHQIYTTFTTPDITGVAGSTIPTTARMDYVVAQIGAAATAANSNTNYAAIMWQLNQAQNAYYLNRSLVAKAVKSTSNIIDAWLLPSVCTQQGAVAYDGNTDTGADCRSINQFMMNVAMCSGMLGKFQSTCYAALYQTAMNPNRPTTAVAGLNLYNNLPPGNDSANAAGKNWVLKLADSHCLDPNNLMTGAGQVGTGANGVGINGFENALVYTDGLGKTWYYPGGTKFCYADANKVVQIFTTLVWVDPKTSVVQFVDYTYTLPANDKP